MIIEQIWVLYKNCESITTLSRQRNGNKPYAKTFCGAYILNLQSLLKFYCLHWVKWLCEMKPAVIIIALNGCVSPFISPYEQPVSVNFDKPTVHYRREAKGLVGWEHWISSRRYFSWRLMETERNRKEDDNWIYVNQEIRGTSWNSSKYCSNRCLSMCFVF